MAEEPGRQKRSGRQYSRGSASHRPAAGSGASSAGARACRLPGERGSIGKKGCEMRRAPVPGVAAARHAPGDVASVAQLAQRRPQDGSAAAAAVQRSRRYSKKQENLLTQKIQAEE